MDGIPVTRHWLIPQASRPKVYTPHPMMTPDEIRARTQGVWDRFYSLRAIWERSRCVTLAASARLAFVLISKLYRQMYANTGIATDSARVQSSEPLGAAHRPAVSTPVYRAAITGIVDAERVARGRIMLHRLPYSVKT